MPKTMITILIYFPSDYPYEKYRNSMIYSKPEVDRRVDEMSRLLAAVEIDAPGAQINYEKYIQDAAAATRESMKVRFAFNHSIVVFIRMKLVFSISKNAIYGVLLSIGTFPACFNSPGLSQLEGACRCTLIKKIFFSCRRWKKRLLAIGHDAKDVGKLEHRICDILDRSSIKKYTNRGLHPIFSRMVHLF
jgi:hypothetical protein